jgi:uncharacterized protein
MNEQIFEAVVTTVSATGAVHVAPMGVRYEGAEVVLMPFKPSTTLDNILSVKAAVLNILVDPRVFAGCVTGRKNWPTLPAERVPGVRLEAALSHVELALAQVGDHPQRPRLRLARVHEVTHRPYLGINRAEAAVVEGAVLVSRLHLLPQDKIDTEMRYLQIAITKTAGPEAHEAWAWLQEAVAAHRAKAVAP